MKKRESWKNSIVYQVYPRSFKDSNGDGIGDIPGIIEKLPYLEKLGINVIWLSPVYASPNDDNGYDISDYYAIMPEFGTMDDMDRLLEESAKRGIRILMDLVVNHTSDEHRWFREALADRNSPYRDYYIWEPGPDRPNNWRAFFQGSVWEPDEKSGGYYLHLFSKKQPDLNWNNREMREEIYAMMRWWLDKGVGGFRLDVFNLFVKPDLHSPAPGSPDRDGLVFNPGYYGNNEGIHEIVREMNREVFSLYDCMTVGEAVEVDPDKALGYVGADREELNMVFHFELVSFDDKNNSNIKRVLQKWAPLMERGGWNSNYLSNHDQPRQVSAFGDDGKFRKESATLLAMMNLSLPGTPYIYQGEELGMTNGDFRSFDQFRDIETLNGIETMRRNGDSDEDILAWVRRKSRDNARTPVQWDSTANGGFTSGEPWIRVNSNYREINGADQMENENSVFSFYRRLIELRKTHPVFIQGDCRFLYEGIDEIIAYRRTDGSEVLTVILNRSDREVTLDSGEVPSPDSVKTALSNRSFLSGERWSGVLTLKPWEALCLIS